MQEKPPPRVEEPPTFLPGEETRKALRAIRRAYALAILEEKAFGLPVIQWREGRGVIRIPAEQLEPASSPSDLQDSAQSAAK